MGKGEQENSRTAWRPPNLERNMTFRCSYVHKSVSVENVKLVETSNMQRML